MMMPDELTAFFDFDATLAMRPPQADACRPRLPYLLGASMPYGIASMLIFTLNTQQLVDCHAPPMPAYYHYVARAHFSVDTTSFGITGRLSRLDARRARRPRSA